MRVRFQAEADLDAPIIRGLKRKQPEIDFHAADSGRILITHDRCTMPSHFARFIAPLTGQSAWSHTRSWA